MERMMAGMAWRPHGIRKEALPLIYEQPTKYMSSSEEAGVNVCPTLDKVLDHAE